MSNISQLGQQPGPDNVKTMLDNIAPRTISVNKNILGADVLLVPNGMKAESVKKYIDEYLLVPERRKGTETANRLESFIDLTNRFKDGSSVVFAKGNIVGDKLDASLLSILDYHPASGDYRDARHCQHRVVYNFPVSKEFQFWLSNNAESMDQTEFALMLEERIGEMVVANYEDKEKIANLSPKFAEPLEVLQLSRDLEIYSSEVFQQAGKLSSGERTLKFSAVHNGADGKPLSVPDFFMLQIPIFAGEMPVRIAVRLRYRKSGEKITWAYDMYRIDQVFQTAFDNTLAAVREKTGLPLYIGAPAN